MKSKKSKKSEGAVSGILLILGVVLLVVIIIVFVVIQINAAKTASKAKEDQTTQTSNEPPKPVYETQLGDVKFMFESATDIGNVLVSKNPAFTPNLVSTERFIKVVIGAQNKGKINVKQSTWNLGNIVDSEGRNFVPINEFNGGYYLLGGTTLCGSLLKPEFEPTPCIKYYEVSKESKGLKVAVDIVNENSAKVSNEQFIDLVVQ